LRTKKKLFFVLTPVLKRSFWQPLKEKFFMVVLLVGERVMASLQMLFVTSPTHNFGA
jgi:hypothetical protein